MRGSELGVLLLLRGEADDGNISRLATSKWAIHEKMERDGKGCVRIELHGIVWEG